MGHIVRSEFFVTLTLHVGDEDIEVDVSNDSFKETERFVDYINTEEGLKLYIESLDFEATFVSFDGKIFRRDISETLVATVTVRPNEHKAL